ncbi:hypothetical protein GCM10020219_024350 [Nonomuraea dietziae]
MNTEETTRVAGRGDMAREALGALRAEVAKAVVGQDAVVTGLVIALLCRGHVLLEGVPGVAKTLMVRTLSAALSLDFKRVQFTPDLMPGDVTGSLIYDAKTAEFDFREGPVFTNLLLADEINRTPPKTQAALLEAMEERQVSVEGDARPLPDPFVVCATQNPVEYEGTYQLPEAQLDRFLLKLTVPLPPRDQEIAVLERHARGFDPRDLSQVKPVASADDLAAGREAVAAVHVAPRGARLHRRPGQGDQAVALAAAGRLASRRDGAAGGLQGVGVAVRPHLRDARRREGAGQARAAAQDPAAARGRARGRDHGRPGSTASWRPCRSPADGTDRAGGAGSGPVDRGGAVRARARLRGARGLPAAARRDRDRPGVRRVGAAADVHPLGPHLRTARRDGHGRADRGESRPSAGARCPARRVAALGGAVAQERAHRRAAGRAAAPGVRAEAHPARRQVVGGGDRPGLRASRAGRAAGWSQRAVDGAGAASLPVAQAPALAPGEAARARGQPPRAGQGAGHGVRLAAGVRGRRRRALHRLARHGPPQRRGGADLAAREGQARADRPRHGAHVGRARGDGMAQARLVHGRRVAAGRAGRQGR